MNAAAPAPVRVLFVFAWLVVGGEETEVRLLARHLDPRRFRIDVVACFRKEGMPEQTHDELAALGIHVDRTPYGLSFDDTVAYLAARIPAYDIVVSCQNPAEVYPALERLHLRPPLIEHGGLVCEALGPKHLTARYVGVCRSIRHAAASRMAGREQDAIEIPSMVDLSAFDRAHRRPARQWLGIAPRAPVIGWVGRLDPKKRVEDFIDAAAVVLAERADARFLVVGGPDAFLPEYAEALRQRAAAKGLGDALRFLGDRTDVPRLLSTLDVFVWLSRAEGMPHVIAEAGAAELPVVATADNGTLQQIEDGTTGLFVPHEAPEAVAAAVLRLLGARSLRRRLGQALRARVARDYAAPVVVREWEKLFADVLAEHRDRPAPPPTLFRSFFQGGFECSTHCRSLDRKRLDMIAATAHDRFAAEDYRALAGHGLLTVRDGVRWHLVETAPGRYDWSSLERQLAAMRETGTEVIWDLLHYGWPDDIDIWRPEFAERFACFAATAAALIGQHTRGVPFFAPVNEISFFAWGGGDVAYLNPFAHGRGLELKVQLVRAAVAAMQAIRAVEPRARFVHADPVINVTVDPARPEEAGAAEAHRQAQFQAWDMIAGRTWPQAGGRPELLDIVGVNYYWSNQWIHHGLPVDIGHQLYRPFRCLLIDTYARYGRPIFVAETGTEGERRPAWLAYICDEVRAARRAGVPVEGICLYPVLDHHGWDDERYCPNGLLRFSENAAGRTAYEPLAEELDRRQRQLRTTPAAAILEPSSREAQPATPAASRQTSRASRRW